jgi:quercetin dioxygenase-like cupin family protein
MEPDVRRARAGGYRWDAVEVSAYKADGEAPFRDVTRQVLFDLRELDCQWRYFEVAPGGWSTLERHRHVHAVLVLRGRGRALLGDRVVDLAGHDLVSVPPLTWHQFRAADDEPLGFLCLVNADRDRPQLPGPADLAALAAASPEVAAFLLPSAASDPT